MGLRDERVLGGPLAGLLAGPVRRLFGVAQGSGEQPASVAAARSGAVVDCALYLHGRRQDGPRDYATAYGRARRHRDAFVWLGLHEPDEATMAAVAGTFGLDELTARQVVPDGHRPLVEKRGDVTMLVLRTASYVEHAELTDTSEVVDTGDVIVLVGRRFLVTVRHGAAGGLSAVRADLQQNPALLARGPWAVAYAVCARMVDLYLEVGNHVEKDLEKLEQTAFARDGGVDVAQVYQLKRELVEFKGAVMPLRVPLQQLTDDGRADVPEALRPYLADVGGRLARAVDRVASLDDLLNSVLQARLAQVAVDQNNDMRKIAAWAAIAAVQTALAGIYGMNFEYMPELQWTYGYPAVVAVMAGAALVLYRRFRRAGWL